MTGTKKYYALGGASILDDNGTLRYLLTDHAGSNVAITNSNGNLLSQQRYMPFGQIRPDVAGISQTDFGYTSQRNMSSLGLMDYNARFYDPELGRFTQPDTIVPSPASPQTWNRYSYVSNNPINFTDPTGHCQRNGHWMDDNSSACLWTPPPTTTTPDLDPDPDPDSDDDDGDDDDGGGQPENPLGTVVNSYMAGWTNFGTAWSTLWNPNASLEGRTFSYAYVMNWAGWHLVGAAAISFLAYRATEALVSTAARIAGGIATSIAARIAAASVAAMVKFDPTQVQSKFLKHASDFGVSGNYNLNTAKEFVNAMKSHIDGAGTQAIQGT